MRTLFRFSFQEEDEVEISCVATSALGSSEANFTIKGKNTLWMHQYWFSFYLQTVSWDGLESGNVECANSSMEQC